MADNKVPYFRHMAKHGRTLYIINHLYKNDGYALFFKLLEVLCDTNNHFIDCKDVNSWIWVLSYFDVEESFANEVLNKLAELGSIDRDLWFQDRVIWSQNLVDSLERVYQRRKRDVPEKPEPTGQQLLSLGASTGTGGRKPKKRKQKSPKITDEQFEELWTVYPGLSRQKGSKMKAREKIQSTTYRHDYEYTKLAFEKYGRYSDTVKNGFIMHMTTFVHQGYVQQWHDEVITVKKSRIKVFCPDCNSYAYVNEGDIINCSDEYCENRPVMVTETELRLIRKKDGRTAGADK